MKDEIGTLDGVRIYKTETPPILLNRAARRRRIVNRLFTKKGYRYGKRIKKR